MKPSWIFLLVLLPFWLQGKVEVPQSFFRLEQLDIFAPGSPLKPIQTQHGEGLTLQKKGKFQTFQFFLKHQHYKFAVYVQAEDGLVKDFHATLPSYFLHDVFHQSLINKLGVQQEYSLKNATAQYGWKKENLYVYTSTCTITCFPLSLSVFPPKESWKGGYKPLIKVFTEKESPLPQDL